jgi:saccharopine dehydrogenase-like NADP-dependent oxidoreductase
MSHNDQANAHTVLVLGGYGFFGSRICSLLLNEPSLRILIGGRDGSKGRLLAKSLGLPNEAAIEIDCTNSNFSVRLRELGVNTLIHTAGPFQNQDYGVARAAIEAGSHYVDLADGRQFVCGIDVLDELAKSKGITVVSGASTVPALSSAVLQHYLPRFASLESVEVAISSGARTPGIATVRGIFGYVGKKILRLENKHWVTTHGWLDLKRYRFPKPLGSRLLGSCDVPDLELFPKRYPSLRTVKFHAGFASHLGHLVVWSIANLVRLGIFRSASVFAVPLTRLSKRIEPLISKRGGMFVRLNGQRRDGAAKAITWHVLAAQNHGPNIPCGASVALIRKLKSGAAFPRGAMPCVGLLTIDEYLAPLRALDIREVADD